MEKEVSFAEKFWHDTKKDLEEQGYIISVVDSQTFETTISGIKKTGRIEKTIPEKIQEMFPEYRFSCAVTKYGHREQYRLFAENKDVMKTIIVLCGEDLIRVAVKSPKTTEIDHAIADAFYDEVIKAHHIRLKVLMGQLKRMNLYRKNA